MKQFPDTVHFGDTPCLRIASSRRMREISVNYFRKVHYTAVFKQRYHGR